MAEHRHIGSFYFDICGLHVSIAVTLHLQDRLLYRSHACAIRDCALVPTLMTFIGSMPGILGRWCQRTGFALLYQLNHLGMSSSSAS